MIARAIEITSLGIFALASVAETFAASLPDASLLQFGALGLVGFMIAHEYRHRTHMAKVIEKKDAQVIEANERAARAAVGFTEAVDKMATTMAGRPCIAEDAIATLDEILTEGKPDT